MPWSNDHGQLIEGMPTATLTRSSRCGTLSDIRLRDLESWPFLFDQCLDSDNAAEFLHCRRALVESRLFFGRQFDFDDLLDALCAQFHRDADVESANSVFTLQVGGAGENFLFVFE